MDSLWGAKSTKSIQNVGIRGTMSRIRIQNMNLNISFAGSSDFFGLNHYTSILVSPGPKTLELSSDLESIGGLVGIKEERDPSWKR